MEAMQRYNQQMTACLRLRMSFGIPIGRVLLFHENLYGDAVNVSSKQAEDMIHGDDFLLAVRDSIYFQISYLGAFRALVRVFAVSVGQTDILTEISCTTFVREMSMRPKSGLPPSRKHV